MKTRAELNARLQLAGMPKGTYAKLLGSTPQSVSRQGDAYGIPAYGISIMRAWEIMTSKQRREWIEETESA